MKPAQPVPGHQRRSYRAWVIHQLLLVVPPTVTVIAAFLVTDTFTHHHVLFASLASSSFLIYRDPLHQMNSIRVMLSAQIIGITMGVLAPLLLGTGYHSATVAMTGAIALMVLLRVVHPPAISTALGFSFIDVRTQPIVIFLLALFLVASLAILQRMVVLLGQRMERTLD